MSVDRDIRGFRGVVGVAGRAGSGKSTVVDGLASRLGGAEIVRFDDFEVAMPADLALWMENGADFDEWAAPSLVAGLADIATAPGPIVFEAPLGRSHMATGRYIDFLVFVDVPADVALARLVLRDSGSAASNGYLHAYESILRRVYAEQRRQVIADADMVVDGLEPPDEVVEEIVARLVSEGEV